MNIYFAGAIRGGREKVNDYEKIVNKLQELGNVLTTHVASKQINEKGEKDVSPMDIFNRDVEWLEQSDLIVAEVSVPSLGIGYELGLAESLGKKIICLYDVNSEKTLSAMIDGNLYFEIIRYESNEVWRHICRKCHTYM